MLGNGWTYLIVGHTKQSVDHHTMRGTFVFNEGETDMGDKGSKDKGKREQQKKAQLSPKEKRKLKKEKKDKYGATPKVVPARN